MAAYYRPATLEDALAIRAGEDVTVLAGGTDVYPARRPASAGATCATPTFSTSAAVPGLRGIAEDGGRWRSAR